jgi:hypothetical protein
MMGRKYFEEIALEMGDFAWLAPRGLIDENKTRWYRRD